MVKINNSSFEAKEICNFICDASFQNCWWI